MSCWFHILVHPWAGGRVHTAIFEQYVMCQSTLGAALGFETHQLILQLRSQPSQWLIECLFDAVIPTSIQPTPLLAHDSHHGKWPANLLDCKSFGGRRPAENSGEVWERRRPPPFRIPYVFDTPGDMNVMLVSFSGASMAGEPCPYRDLRTICDVPKYPGRCPGL